MNKIFSTIAIAGLGASLAVGAHAQAVLGTTTGLYTLNVTAPTVSLSSPGVYEYSYTATLGATSAGLNINSFVIGNIAGITGTPTVVNFVSGGIPQTDFAGSQLGSTDTFSALTGFTNVNDKVTFNVFSTLPVATGTVQLTSNGTASSATTDQGPGPAAAPAVPEAGSFALLGLGLLPLAFLARRRMTNNA